MKKNNTPENSPRKNPLSIIKAREAKHGECYESNSMDNNVTTELMGIIVRQMGMTANTSYKNDPSMDFVVGVYLKQMLTPEHQAREAAKDTQLRMFAASLGVQL